jgi:L-cystine transport system permease protein
MMDRPFHGAFLLTLLPRLAAYLPVTLGVTLATAALGLALGFVLARARLSGSPAAAAAARLFITAMRCTPSIVLLFLVYYGLPALSRALFGQDIDGAPRAIFVVLTLTLLFAANAGEMMRAAYLSVDKGQREAALSVGLSEARAFLLVVFPQAARAAIGPLGNALIALMKEGALAYTIGMIDVMGQGNLIIARNYGSYALETYLALALIYWLLTLLVEQGFGLLERRLSQGHA